MAIKVRKAKLAKAGTVEVQYIDADGNDITLKGINICHPDLQAAFEGLIPFLADLTEQKESDYIDWDGLDTAEMHERLRFLSVSGFTLSDDEVNPMVTLIGKRTLRSSKVLNLCAPATALTSDVDNYARCDHLDLAIKRAVYEVEEYVTERKWKAKQETIDFENADDPFAQPDPTDAVDAPTHDVA